MKWYEDFNTFFEAFVRYGVSADETTFYFKNDSDKDLHYIGYIPEYEKPYWVGYCDIHDGIDFLTADELFDAKIFDGKSIKERWNEVVICDFGGISIDSFIYSKN